MSVQLIIILIIEVAIFSFFDTRKSTFNAIINGVALIAATYFTYSEYGFSFMILIPTIGMMIVGGILGGIVSGFITKSQRG